MTFAPKLSASSLVLSVEWESTTTISSASPLTDWRQRAILCSSLKVIMVTDRLIMGSIIHSSPFFRKAKCLLEGKLYLFEGFLCPNLAKSYFFELEKELSWLKTTISLYGKTHPVPRLVAWYGDKGLNYSYSGLSLKSPGWTPLLEILKNEVQKETGGIFNSVLANLYQKGSDHMGWHRDNEPELGKRPLIASLNFGETRRFLLRSIKGKKSHKIDLINGSLLLMMGDLQENWQHRISPTKKEVGGRINLTFRKILK